MYIYTFKCMAVSRSVHLMYIHLNVQTWNLPFHLNGSFQCVLETAVEHKFFPGQSWKMPNVPESTHTRCQKSWKLARDKHIYIYIYIYIYIPSVANKRFSHLT